MTPTTAAPDSTLAAQVLGFQPDVVHLNDWQTGLIPVYLRTLYRDHPLLGGLASVFTIHNLAYQGVFWHYDMPMTGLGWDLFTPAGIEKFFEWRDDFLQSLDGPPTDVDRANG